MNANNVYSKITEFAERTEKTISVSEFIDLLKTTSRTNKMNIVWFTEGSADGSGKPPHQSKHLMWWDESEYVGGAAGGSDTKAAQEQFNLQTTRGQWITLSYENIISMSYKGRIYRVV
jgi:hypothetical protein